MRNSPPRETPSSPHSNSSSGQDAGQTPASPGLFGKHENAAPVAAPTASAHSSQPRAPLAATPSNASPSKAPQPYKKGSLKENGITGNSKNQHTEKHKTPSPHPNHNKQRRINIIIASILGVLVLVLAVILVVIYNAQKAPSSSLSVLSSSTVTESGYDKDANSLPVSKFSGTILEETKDAGKEYVNDTLFLGDSNTARMLIYNKTTGVTTNTSIGVVGMAIQGASTQRCVRFSGYKDMTMTQAVKVLQPRRIVITFGTNNAPSNQVESFIEAYNNVLDEIHESYPATDIIIGAVPPIAKNHINEKLNIATIDKYNYELAELAKKKGYKFLNWSEMLKDSSSGYIKAGYADSDGIHLTESALEAMFKYFRTHSYVTEDKRPKPLTSIPTRVEIPQPKPVSKAPVATASKVVAPSSTVPPVSVAPPPPVSVAPPPPVSVAPPPPVSVAPPPPVSVAPPPPVSVAPPPLEPPEPELPPEG